MEAEERRVWAIRGAITVDSDSVEAVDSAVKEMLDAIRCRNGNLTIVCGRRNTVQDEL